MKDEKKVCVCVEFYAVFPVSGLNESICIERF